MGWPESCKVAYERGALDTDTERRPWGEEGRDRWCHHLPRDFQSPGAGRGLDTPSLGPEKAPTLLWDFCPPGLVAVMLRGAPVFPERTHC